MFLGTAKLCTASYCWFIHSKLVKENRGSCKTVLTPRVSWFRVCCTNCESTYVFVYLCNVVVSRMLRTCFGRTHMLFVEYLPFRVLAHPLLWFNIYDPASSVLFLKKEETIVAISFVRYPSSPLFRFVCLRRSTWMCLSVLLLLYMRFFTLLMQKLLHRRRHWRTSLYVFITSNTHNLSSVERYVVCLE